MSIRPWLAGLALSLLPVFTQAADVTLAVRTDVSSVDPHYHVYVPNRSLSRHIFDSLCNTDPRGRIIPNLATSWKPVGETM